MPPILLAWDFIGDAAQHQTNTAAREELTALRKELRALREDLIKHRTPP